MPFSERTLAAIDQAIDEGALAAHPLVTAWAEGQLSRDDLRAFATQYYQHLNALPRYVSTVHAGCDDLQIRRTLLELLTVIEATSPTVSELWLQSCAALGLFSDSVRQATSTTATQACINDFVYLCQSGTAQGLAALYTYVRQIPQVARLQRQGLIDHYGMTQGPGIEVFDVRSYRAGVHAGHLREALVRAIDCDDMAREALGATDAALTALRGMFSGAMPQLAAR